MCWQLIRHVVIHWNEALLTWRTVIQTFYVMHLAGKDYWNTLADPGVREGEEENPPSPFLSTYLIHPFLFSFSFPAYPLYAPLLVALYAATLWSGGPWGFLREISLNPRYRWMRISILLSNKFAVLFRYFWTKRLHGTQSRIIPIDPPLLKRVHHLIFCD